MAISQSDPANEYVPVTPGPSILPNRACRALICTNDGFLNLTQPNGTPRVNVPVFAGFNPLGALIVNTPSAGTAPTAVWALY